MFNSFTQVTYNKKLQTELHSLISFQRTLYWVNLSAHPFPLKTTLNHAKKNTKRVSLTCHIESNELFDAFIVIKQTLALGQTNNSH